MILDPIFIVSISIYPCLFSDTNDTCSIMSFVNSIPYFIIFFDEVFAIIKNGEIVGQLALLMCSNIALVLMITNIS